MSRVALPVDRLEAVWPNRFRSGDLRLGALLHGASVTSELEPVLGRLEGLERESFFRISALFGPQHGFQGTTQDNMIEWESYRHPRLQVPVHSLYGEHRKPTPSMLAGIDALFVDLVDIGTRYYTFIWTLLLAMEACAEAGVPVILADRPNPLNGESVEGDPQREDHVSFVGLRPLPVRHGMTIGELAIHFRDENAAGTDLVVLPMEGWKRWMWHDDTGLPWVMPSPNMPSLDTATVYPGMCLFEGTNVSEGRGTTRPFELFGAPWIDGEGLADELNSLELPGARFRPVAFEPGFQKSAGEVCQGCQLHVTERNAFLPYHTGVSILRVIGKRYPAHFQWNAPPYEYEYEKLPIEILTGRPVADTFPELV